MLSNRNFWIAQMLGLSLFYVAAVVLVMQGQAMHIVVKIAVVILIAHVLELPVAFSKLKEKNPQPLRVLLFTLLYGLLWWVPAKRGLFAVR